MRKLKNVFWLAKHVLYVMIKMLKKTSCSEMEIRMHRFDTIKKRLLQLAERTEDIKAMIEIGSQARTYEKADEYSDLDLLFVTDAVSEYLNGDDRLAQIGTIKISFVEPTLGGASERRILFDGSLDVDLVVLTPEQCREMIENHIADVILGRGCQVLYDVMDVSEKIEKIAVSELVYTEVVEKEFVNMVNDFWYHVVWTAKKADRGEIWTAKMCLDNYMKHQLLRMMEWYHKSLYGERYDVWHDGRFLEKWADGDIVKKLANCFARYDKKEIGQALAETAELFGRMAKICAEKKQWHYPQEAEAYAKTAAFGDGGIND